MKVIVNKYHDAPPYVEVWQPDSYLGIYSKIIELSNDEANHLFMRQDSCHRFFDELRDLWYRCQEVK